MDWSPDPLRQRLRNKLPLRSRIPPQPSLNESMLVVNDVSIFHGYRYLDAVNACGVDERGAQHERNESTLYCHGIHRQVLRTLVHANTSRSR
jgi:hypothetical protein